MPAALAKRKSVFSAIRDHDILVHHPYESFGAVVQFIEQASEDPQVLAIKMTLYRTAEANPIITALARAAENGKQVTAFVELQARLDEENNIDKARMLQKAGVHVVYGIVGLKTHCKATLVVRREHDGIRRYVHLGTGNYNPTTARLYTDLSFFTCRPEFGEDASALFNLLTGYSEANHWNKLIVAPSHLADRLAALIEREWRTPRQANPRGSSPSSTRSSIPRSSRCFTAPRNAGVRIDLIIRGTCCLRTGLPGISDNIRVISIVDKYLEHSRITYFQNGDEPEVFLASADWMPRNFRRRVEIMFPIEDPAAQAQAGRRHSRGCPRGQREGARASAGRVLPASQTRRSRRTQHPLPARIPEAGVGAGRDQPDQTRRRPARCGHLKKETRFASPVTLIIGHIPSDDPVPISARSPIMAVQGTNPLSRRWLCKYLPRIVGIVLIALLGNGLAQAIQKARNAARSSATT